MTSEKSYATEQRLNALIPTLAPSLTPAFFPGITILNNGNMGSTTVPGGDPVFGAIYELEIWGYGQQGSIGNRQTLAFDVIFGGTNMSTVTFGTIALPDTSALFRWYARARVICNSAGAAGTWTSYIDATLSQFNVNISVGNANFARGFSTESTNTTTKDTTVNQSLAIKATWGATTGAPTITSNVALARRIA